jgi:cellulose synthase/poly-beta-1,6-N-acetylglucosamine synthase-like glycosyltransferase
MASQPRVSGVIALYRNGVQMRVKGNVEYSMNRFERVMVVGADGVHGYAEKPRIPYVQATLTDTSDFDTREVTEDDSATIALHLANGKTVGLRNAVFTGDGATTTEESEFSARWEGVDSFEVL